MTTSSLESPRLPQSLAMPSSTKKGSSKTRGRLIGLAFLAVVVGLGYTFRQRVFSVFGGSQAASTLYQTQKVEKGLLRVTVTEDGNVESAQNQDVKCMVEGGSQILWIIPEGTMVKKGAELVKLNSANIQEQITTQKIAYEKARSTLIRAEEDFAVKSIAVKEYLEGNFVKELQVAESNIVIANENLKNAQNNLEHSERMFRKGYINQLQLEQNKFAVERAKIDVDTHTTTRKVLMEYTKPKMLRELESNRDAAQADMLASKAACDLEKSKLDRLEEQLKRCIIFAPADGMVVYANDQSKNWRANSTIVEEGATVRESQTLIRLPDLNDMQAKVLVHESKIDTIKVGMPAKIRIRDREWSGSVTTIASQPEVGNWFSSAVKDYATTVHINGLTIADAIKPGMTAEVEIEIAELSDVMSVPLTGIVESGGKYTCYVKKGPSYEARPVVIGMSNEKFIEIKDGLLSGDEVILNPRSSIEEAKTVALAKSAHSPGPGNKAGASDKGEKKSDKKDAPANSAEGEKKSQGKSGDLAASKPADGKASKKAGRNFDLMSLDKNGDGKVAKDELPERMQPMMPALDTNKDGFIDSKEVAEARKKFAQQQGGAANGPGAPGGPAAATPGAATGPAGSARPASGGQ